MDYCRETVIGVIVSIHWIISDAVSVLFFGYWTRQVLIIQLRNQSIVNECDSGSWRLCRKQGCSLGLERLGLVSVSASYVSFT